MLPDLNSSPKGRGKVVKIKTLSDTDSLLDSSKSSINSRTDKQEWRTQQLCKPKYPLVLKKAAAWGFTTQDKRPAV